MNLSTIRREANSAGTAVFAMGYRIIGSIGIHKMIQLQGMSYTYPNAISPTLQDIDLAVADGEWILLAGPSGCGKSTLLYLLNGLIPHVLSGELRGDVQIDGIAPRELSVRELSHHVGTVFQNPEAQLFTLRVGDDVAFGCENLCFSPEETRHRVQYALGRLSLAELCNREISSLSGGQKQRTAIAGALAMGCQTLLLDEPTSDLDEPSRRELLATLEELHRAGHTILMTEHRLEGLESLVNRVVTIEEGRIIADGVFPKETPLQRRIPKPQPKDATLRVDLHDVAFAYPNHKPFLEHLSLQLHAGEIVALLGNNGSGKTTLLKLLCGLLQTTHGYATIAGKENPSLNDLVGHVGFLFQNPDEQLFADTVADEIAFGPKNLKRPIDVDCYLKRLGLDRYRNEHPRCLSRGERQRLAAATVLAMRPELVLLDEPTTGLDRNAWTALMDFIVEEAAEYGATIVFSTHHIDTADAFAGRVITLSQGRIVDDRVF
jgi:energy-coupling factor transporter ATP-binding protein EcfA2